MRPWKAFLLLAVFALGLGSRLCLERSYYASQLAMGQLAMAKTQVTTSHSEGGHPPITIQAKIRRGKRRMRHEFARERVLATVGFQFHPLSIRISSYSAEGRRPSSYSSPPSTPPPTCLAA